MMMSDTELADHLAQFSADKVNELYTAGKNDAPYWALYAHENCGIHLDDGDFDPAIAPVIGRLAQ